MKQVCLLFLNSCTICYLFLTLQLFLYALHNKYKLPQSRFSRFNWKQSNAFFTFQTCSESILFKTRMYIGWFLTLLLLQICLEVMISISYDNLSSVIKCNTHTRCHLHRNVFNKYMTRMHPIQLFNELSTKQYPLFIFSIV